MKIKFKTVSHSGNFQTLTVDTNYRYQIYVCGVKMYTGHNPVEFHTWRLIGWLIGEYSYVWLSK